MPEGCDLPVATSCHCHLLQLQPPGPARGFGAVLAFGFLLSFPSCFLLSPRCQFPFRLAQHQPVLGRAMSHRDHIPCRRAETPALPAEAPWGLGPTGVAVMLHGPGPGEGAADRGDSQPCVYGRNRGPSGYCGNRALPRGPWGCAVSGADCSTGAPALVPSHQVGARCSCPRSWGLRVLAGPPRPPGCSGEGSGSYCRASLAVAAPCFTAGRSLVVFVIWMSDVREQRAFARAITLNGCSDQALLGLFPAVSKWLKQRFPVEIAPWTIHHFPGFSVQQVLLSHGHKLLQGQP